MQQIKMARSFVGIQLGNSSAKIAIYNEGSGSVTVVTNEDGDRVLPVNVATHHGTDELSFQLNPLAARSKAINCLYENFFFHFCNDPEQGKSFDYGGGLLTVEQLCLSYLQKLFEIILSATGCTQIDSLVLSLSNSLYNETEGKRRIEGLFSNDHKNFPCVKKFCIEGQAKCSLLEWISNRENEIKGNNWAVLELGHSATYLNHFYLSKIDSALKIAQLPKTRRFDSFSGGKTDLVLHQMVLQDAQRKFKTSEFSARMVNKLKGHYEGAKRTLSQSGVAQIWVESWYDGMDFSTTLHRNKYELLLEPHVKELIGELRGVEGLKDCNILVVGSSSKKPYLVKAIKGEFSSTVLVNDPDEIASKGAAYLAYLAGTGSRAVENATYASSTIVLRTEQEQLELISEGSLLTADFPEFTCSVDTERVYQVIELPNNTIASFKAPTSFKAKVVCSASGDGLVLRGARVESEESLFEIPLCGRN